MANHGTARQANGQADERPGTTRQTTTRNTTRRAFLGAVGTAGGASVACSSGLPLGSPEPALSHEAIPLDAPIPVEEAPTPALLVDVAAMERNLAKMAAHAEEQGVSLRPHTKTHKCPLLARHQMDLGAVGVCCAKVGEAEVMVDAGVEEVLITSPVVTDDKIGRVVALSKKSSEVALVVDNQPAAERLAEAAAAAGVTQRVLVDLDVGTRRTGIAVGEPALELARAIDGLSNLDLQGLQAYAGHLMHVHGHAERQTRSLAALETAVETKRLIEDDGIELAVLTGGGTGTWDIDSAIDGMTDLQVGSYLFMDEQYRKIGSRSGEVFDDFETSLFVVVTAISQPAPGMITTDGGYKAFASDADRPRVADMPGVVYGWGGDEHGMLRIADAARPPQLGDRLWCVTPHCDPTVNLYDVYHPVRNGRVEELWPISARGKSQ